MDWYQRRTIKTATECLAPDYDIQVQMEEIYDTMELEIPTEWVKGYQDKNKQKKELTWEEQLNICVDELASIARSEITRKH
eukprot:78627-Ditylum_brightwellii.AAC.1